MPVIIDKENEDFWMEADDLELISSLMNENSLRLIDKIVVL